MTYTTAVTGSVTKHFYWNKNLTNICHSFFLLVAVLSGGIDDVGRVSAEHGRRSGLVLVWRRISQKKKKLSDSLYVENNIKKKKW